jgi:hypothetical protein
MQNKHLYFHMHTCLTYLSLDMFRKDYYFDYEGMESFLHRNPLLDYTASNWGHHAHGEGEESSMDLVLQFLQRESSVACASQVLLCRDPWLFKPTIEISRMHLLSFFGL